MVKIKNVYWMLVYAFRLFHEQGIKNMETEEFDNIYDLLASLLITGLNKQLKRGLNKEYVLNTEDLFGLKGKINVSDSIKYNTIMKHKMICEYDEFCENSYMNKIIKKTLIVLMKYEKLKKDYKNKIKKIILFLGNVDEIESKSINWNNLRYNKNNITYKMLMNICYLILHDLIYTDKKGKDRYMTFLDDQSMSALYERFVKEYFRMHFSKLNAKSMHIDWNIKEGEDFGLLPDMRTDISLSYNNCFLIIDTKYHSKTMQYNSLYKTKSIMSKDIYQIFAYVKNMDKYNTGNVKGMLLYAKTDEDIFPNQSNNICNNSFSFIILDLTDSFDIVKSQLDDIAYKFSNGEIVRAN